MKIHCKPRHRGTLQTEAPRHIANRGALQDTSQIIEVHCK